MSSVTSDLHPERPGWQARAACNHTDLDMFFVDRFEDNTRAKAICAVCVVRESCLEHAITNNIKHGVWGGKGVRERRAIRRDWLASGRVVAEGGGQRKVTLRLVKGGGL